MRRDPLMGSSVEELVNLFPPWSPMMRQRPVSLKAKSSQVLGTKIGRIRAELREDYSDFYCVGWSEEMDL